MPREPSPALEQALARVLDRLRLTDASPAIQRAFALAWRRGTGRVVLTFILRELETPLYSVGQRAEVAVAQCSRQEFAAMIRDIIRRGNALLRGDKAG